MLDPKPREPMALPMPGSARQTSSVTTTPVEAVHPRAAVLLGDFRRDEVVLCRLLHQFRRVSFLPIAFLSERLDFVLAEFAHRFSEFILSAVELNAIFDV